MWTQGPAGGRWPGRVDAGAGRGPLAWKGGHGGRPGAVGLGLRTRGAPSRWPGRVDAGLREPLAWGCGRGALGAARTFVSSRTLFCSRRARASCVSRRFLSSSSWPPSWRTSSWSCSRAFSSSRALQEQKGRGVRPSAHASLSPETEPHVRPARPPLLNSYLEPFRRLRIQTGPRVTPEHVTRSGEDRRLRAEAPLKEPGQPGALPTGPQEPFPPPDNAELQRGGPGGLELPPTTDQGGRPQARSPARPSKCPRPSQPAGPSSTLACSHSDFQSPVPSHLHQRCPHTDTPVLCEGTATRGAPGRHATTGQGGTSPRGIGRGRSTVRTQSSRHSK